MVRVDLLVSVPWAMQQQTEKSIFVLRCSRNKGSYNNCCFCCVCLMTVGRIYSVAPAKAQAKVRVGVLALTPWATRQLIW